MTTTIRLPYPDFDWKNPDYRRIAESRLRLLKHIREGGDARLQVFHQVYKANPAQFICDWGVTYDPRNPEIGQPATIPFIPYPRQVEWIDFILRKWRERQPGLTEKSREIGVSWLAIAMSCALCLYYEGISIGFGSRKTEYVDQAGEPKSLFEKARVFLQAIPPEFRGGWMRKLHASHMRIRFPKTGAIMGGEGGDEIGRGDRRSIYFVDEAAHLEHPELADFSLSHTTNCRQDVSSVKGRANSFAAKRFGGKIEVFTFHWTHDPRKDQAWYDKQVAEKDNPVIIAQELDIDYQASVGGVLIPSAWIVAAIDAHLRLDLKPTGMRSGGLDVADEGIDLNAYCGAHGWLVEHLEEWSGKGSDTFETARRAFHLTDELGYTSFRYDADGLGAYIRGDARVINEDRDRMKRLVVLPFRGSGEVQDPLAEDVPGRKNEDYFANFKAQSYWSLRSRFRRTYRWLTEGVACDPSQIISLSSKLPNRQKLIVELSQPTWKLDNAGRVIINKKPDNTRSPNLADAVMIRMAPAPRQIIVSAEAMARSKEHA